MDDIFAESNRRAEEEAQKRLFDFDALKHTSGPPQPPSNTNVATPLLFRVSRTACAPRAPRVALPLFAPGFTVKALYGDLVQVRRILTVVGGPIIPGDLLYQNAALATPDDCVALLYLAPEAGSTSFRLANGPVLVFEGWTPMDAIMTDKTVAQAELRPLDYAPIVLDLDRDPYLPTEETPPEPGWVLTAEKG